VVELFFQLAFKWSKWCVQTLHPFSQILKIFPRIGAPIVAPSSYNYRQDWPQGSSSAGIVFTHGPIFGFFAPHGGHVEQIKVKYCWEERTIQGGAKKLGHPISLQIF